ncbi:NIPSNAP family protein (plasmid) [Sinorhizobium meliloti]|nr:NIPSNAP family protein [Sinorhizobium meliloti]
MRFLIPSYAGESDVYEIRTYRLRNGAIPTYLRWSRRRDSHPEETSRRTCRLLLLRIGPINEIVHIWAYPSLDERERRRAALMNDAAWRDFLPKIRDLIEVVKIRS